MTKSTSKKLALVDIDKTIYKGHIVTDLPRYLVSKGIVDKQIIVEQQNEEEKCRAGKLSYEDYARNVLKLFARGIQGKRTTDVYKFTETFIAETKKIYKYFPQFVNLIKEEFDIYLVSGEPEFVCDALLNKYNLNGRVASVFSKKNGIFTGKTDNLLFNGEEKVKALQNLLVAYDLSGSIALGDSMVDYKMLNAVQFAICVKPDGSLAKVAQQKDWLVAEPDGVIDIINSLGLKQTQNI